MSIVCESQAERDFCKSDFWEILRLRSNSGAVTGKLCNIINYAVITANNYEKTTYVTKDMKNKDYEEKCIIIKTA